ncbi:MAG: glycosyltransferase, partial [Calditrichota bacterium]
MMNIKNEDRWLQEVLDSIARIAEGIVILDDGSTDQTPQICRSHPALLDYYRQENVPLDKVRDKNRILHMALAQRPDWILCLDGDEVLEESAPQRIREAIRTCPDDVSGFNFEFLYMWNDRNHYRIDGIYNHILHPCLFRLAGQNAEALGFFTTDHGGNLHCERVPGNLQGRIVEADIKILHLGYMHEASRRKKYDWNKARDPKYANQGYYEHLLDQPGQVLVEWQERPFPAAATITSTNTTVSTQKQEIKPEYYYANARRNLVDLVPPTAKRVLDVGCGQGMTGGLLRAERKIEVVGLEIHPEVANVAEQHLSRVIIGDLETMDLPITDGYFDCIIMGDVLEHLVDPWTSLKKLLRVLHPTGTIIASVPNIRNLGIIKKLLEGSWTYEEWGILDKTHLRFFAYKNMLEMFEQAGLDVSLAEVVRDPLFEKEMANPPQATTDVDTGKLLLRSVHPDDLNELTAQQFIFTGKLKETVTADKPPEKDQQQPEASVIIPVWNNLHYTRQCITSLFMVKEPVDFEVIVVNNGSDDGTAEFLSQLPPPVRTVTLSENRGFAKGSNAGAAVARGKYLVFLNNDTIVQPGWLKEMVTCIKTDPTIGLVGNLQIFPDSGNVQQCGIVCGPDHMVYSIYHNQLPADHPAVNKPREFQFIAGSCMLLERDLFSSLGGFDEAYLNSCEDVDLCMKVRESGKKVFYCPQSKIFHFESKTVNGHPKDSVNYRRFLQRWKDKMIRDDLDYMREDGFLTDDKTPVTMNVPPQETESATLMETSVTSEPSMPKVGILTTYHQPCGLAKYAESLVDALKANGCDPIILAEKTDEAYGQDEPYVQRCWTRQPEGGREIVPLIKALGIEVLHVNHGGIFALDGWLPQVMQEVRKLGVRIVTTFHTTESVAPQFTLVARYSDRMIGHHPQNEIELAAVGAPIHRFEWMPIGMSPVASADLFEAKLKLGLDPAQKIVSTFGFVESYKGIIELILAMKPVIQHLKSHLYVLGAPHPHSSDPGYIEKCRQRAAELGIAEYVHISGEYLSDEEVELRLQASDAIVLNYQSYRYEGSAAAMTALSSGRPVITSSVPTFDLPSALTFKLTKDFNLSEAIYDVLTNPFITQVLKKNVAEYAKTANWIVTAQRHLEVYRKTLNEPAQTDIDFLAYYRTHPDEIYAEPLQRERVRWLKSKAEGRILEIGPATGYVSEFVGASAAVDINRGRLAVCEALRPGIQFLYGNVIEGLPFPDKAFDQVMAPEILEHVDFDQAVTVLRECARIGKQVLITIPNADKPNYNPDLVHNYEHRWIVNRQSLDRLLSEAGCSNYELDTSNDLDFYLLDIHADVREPRARIHERAAMLSSVELDPGEPLHIAIDTSVIESPTIFDYDIAQYTINQLRELITIRPQWTFALFGVHSRPKSSIVRDLADYSNCRYSTWAEFTNRMPEILYLPNPMSEVGKQALESVFNSDLFVAAT